MNKWILFGVMALVAACGVEGEAGDACEVDDDCAEELHCHIEDGAGVCEDDHEEHTGEDHDDEDHTGEDHDDETM